MYCDPFTSRFLFGNTSKPEVANSQRQLENSMSAPTALRRQPEEFAGAANVPLPAGKICDDDGD